uniref:Uncharacterized protein n=1 Tax=Romanomermis culicivorax TaxID=13658 RepID=A0A915IRN1_ROMCU
MCSYHGLCTHKDASCQTQHPDSAGPSNTATTSAGRCYFCQMRCWIFSRRSGFRTDTVTCLAAAASEICDEGQCKPIKDAKNDWRHQHGHVVSTDGRFPIRHRHDGAVWSMDLAKKYPHLPWVLLNEPLEVEVLRAAVDAVHHAVEQAGRNAQNTAVVAALPSTTKTAAQTLVAIALQQPVATAKPMPTVANAFGETLRAIKDNVSIIEASPFPAATAPWSPKIGVLCKVHPCMVLVIDFPGKKLISSHDNGE